MSKVQVKMPLIPSLFIALSSTILERIKCCFKLFGDRAEFNCDTKQYTGQIQIQYMYANKGNWIGIQLNQIKAYEWTNVFKLLNFVTELAKKAHLYTFNFR